MKNIEKLDKESNHDYALRVIRQNLINLELQPGTLISEQDIANELKLSRTPVHEALQELSKTKIIDIYPQRGSLVSLIDMSLIDESVFMRVTIESAVAEMACALATEQDILELEENINLQDFYKSKNNTDKFLELDNAFHEIMYRITNKMQCHYMVRTMNIHYDRYRELKLHTTDPSSIVEEHKKILEAFKNKDCKAAKEALQIHLKRHQIDEEEIRSRFPNYFEEI